MPYTGAQQCWKTKNTHSTCKQLIVKNTTVNMWHSVIMSSVTGIGCKFSLIKAIKTQRRITRMCWRVKGINAHLSQMSKASSLTQQRSISIIINHAHTPNSHCTVIIHTATWHSSCVATFLTHVLECRSNPDDFAEKFFTCVSHPVWFMAPSLSMSQQISASSFFMGTTR